MQLPKLFREHYREPPKIQDKTASFPSNCRPAPHIRQKIKPFATSREAFARIGFSTPWKTRCGGVLLPRSKPELTKQYLAKTQCESPKTHQAEKVKQSVRA